MYFKSIFLRCCYFIHFVCYVFRILMYFLNTFTIEKMNINNGIVIVINAFKQYYAISLVFPNFWQIAEETHNERETKLFSLNSLIQHSSCICLAQIGIFYFSKIVSRSYVLNIHDNYSPFQPVLFCYHFLVFFTGIYLKEDTLAFFLTEFWKVQRFRYLMLHSKQYFAVSSKSKNKSVLW